MGYDMTGYEVTYLVMSLARLTVVLACFHVYSEIKSRAVLFIGLAFTISFIASLVSALKAAMPLNSDVRAYVSLTLSVLYTSSFAYGMVLLVKEFRR